MLGQQLLYFTLYHFSSSSPRPFLLVQASSHAVNPSFRDTIFSHTHRFVWWHGRSREKESTGGTRVFAGEGERGFGGSPTYLQYVVVVSYMAAATFSSSFLLERACRCPLKPPPPLRPPPLPPPPPPPPPTLPSLLLFPLAEEEEEDDDKIIFSFLSSPSPFPASRSDPFFSSSFSLRVLAALLFFQRGEKENSQTSWQE